MNIIEKVRLIADGEFEVCAKLSVDEITQICRDLRGAKYALDIAEQKLASMENQEPEPYDAGFLNDFGGGNVSWWHDYIRAELDRAHDHYVEQFNVPADKPAGDNGTGNVLWSDSHSEDEILEEHSDNALFDVVANLWEDIRCLKEDKPAVAVPDDVGMIPMINGKPKVTGRMKVECIGEFSWREEAPYYDENGELHDHVATHEVPWGVCKEIYKRMASAALLAAPSHSQQSTQQIPECFKKLTRHAVGMCFGADWNNGTAATIHRENLINSAWECDKYLSENSHESEQGGAG